MASGLVMQPRGFMRAARPASSAAAPRVLPRQALPAALRRDARAAVLQREPSARNDFDEEAAMESARRAIARLLAPSLAAEGALGAPAPPPPAGAPLEAGTVWYFAYGANMAFATLSRRGVSPLARDPAMTDASTRMVFRHRGGEPGTGGALACARRGPRLHARASGARPPGPACCAARGRSTGRRSPPPPTPGVLAHRVGLRRPRHRSVHN
jgi:hypothetical protein